MKKEELQKIIKLHALWLANDPKGARANLQNADLRGANLQSALLDRAYLQGANLRGATLHDKNGVLNSTITKTWKDSFKDAIHFYSVFKR